MRQPYSSWAKALLERQHYPDLRMYPGGPPKRPYDTTAETLPLLFGVDARAVEQPIREPLTRESFPFDVPSPQSFRAADTDTWRTVTALWKAGKPVWRNITSGDFAPSNQGDGWKQVKQPRIALYRSYVPAMDEGWTRWLFDHFGFAFHTVDNSDLRNGDLKSKYDVVIFPDQAANTITQGYKAGSMPEAYTGGLGEKGIDAVKDFASGGGTVLCFNHSASFCIDRLGAEATNLLSGRVASAGGDESHRTGQEAVRSKGGGSAFYSPGSLLNVSLNLSSPLTRGLPEHIAIWSEQSPAFESKQTSVAEYPADNILASGWLLGGELLANKSALVDAKVGSGHVILFGLRPQYRAQSYQSFKLLFNSLIAYQQ